VDEAAIAARLVRRYTPDRWAVLRQVQNIPGARVQGVRVADVICVALWPSMRGRVEVVEIKCRADDAQHEWEDPEKGEAFDPWATARWFAVPCPWQRVMVSEAIFRERFPGCGLLSVGTGAPRPIVPADKRKPTAKLDPFMLSLLRAAQRPSTGAPR
jgi:hypothetical protein